jgi:glycosyltransferase involved in cell wall biosynthesis
MIIINATALRNSGALTILYQFIDAIPDDSFKYLLFVDESVSLNSIPENVQIEFLNVRSFIKRFWWDAFGLKKWLKQHNICPEIALSLQNTNFRLNKTCPNYVYYHQSIPLFPFKWNCLKKDERPLWFYKNIYPFFVKLFINSQTEVFVQLNYIKDAFSTKYNFPKDKIHVVFPKIEISSSDENKKDAINIDKNKLNLFYPATLFFYKNHDILFKAFSMIDKKLSQKIALYLSVEFDFNTIYNFENIEIVSLGQIPRSEMFYWYTNVDALVFPSYIETLGLPLLEAASLGLPIVASDLSYAREVLEGYEGISYISYHDAKAWGNEILKLSLNPKNKFSPFQINNKNSWDDLFRIIKQKCDV